MLSFESLIPYIPLVCAEYHIDVLLSMLKYVTKPGVCILSIFLHVYYLIEYASIIWSRNMFNRFTLLF